MTFGSKAVPINPRRSNLLSIPAVILLLIGYVPIFVGISDYSQTDIIHYHNIGKGISRGILPYAQAKFGYPPYALLLTLPAAFFRHVEDFRLFFGLEILAFDFFLKILLLRVGYTLFKGWESLVPCTVYSITVAAQSFHVLQRFDVVPTALCIAGLLAFASQKHVLSGLFLAISCGIKLFPVFGLLPLVMRLKRDERWKFTKGLYIGLLPIIVCSVWLPWWRFASIQNGRGLQVESVYAAVLWLLKRFGYLEVSWAKQQSFFELSGPAAIIALAVGKLVLFMTVLWSMFCSARFLKASETDIQTLAKSMLIVTLAFVSFNTVLSPQFLIWLAPLVGIALAGDWRKLASFITAAILTPVVFPSADYESGLGIPHTIALLIRNAALILLWGALLRSVTANPGILDRSSSEPHYK